MPKYDIDNPGHELMETPEIFSDEETE